MNILHISDTHTFQDQIPVERFASIDTVIFSGDASIRRDIQGNKEEILKFLEWYEKVPVKNKVFVAGNHDLSIERRKITPGDFAKAGIFYLENSACIIDGLKFYGTPITPTYGEWAFMKQRNKTPEVWAKIPMDTDVLIVHGPPRGIRDLSYNRDNELEMCGDRALLSAVKLIQPKLMCFGHIHNVKDIENQGVSTYATMQTIFSNAACVEDGKFEYGLTSFGNIITL